MGGCYLHCRVFSHRVSEDEAYKYHPQPDQCLIFKEISLLKYQLSIFRIATKMSKSPPTTPAYVVHVNDSGRSFRDHPVHAFQMDHRDALDNGSMKTKPYTEFHSKNFVFTKPDGTSFDPGQSSFDAMMEGYSPFTEHLHEVHYLCAYEHNGQWENMASANIFANLLVPGEKTKTDLSGRKWDVSSPAAVRFQYETDSGGPRGFKLKSMTVYGDGVPLVSEMIKRGMVKPEQLLA